MGHGEADSDRDGDQPEEEPGGKADAAGDPRHRDPRTCVAVAAGPVDVRDEAHDP
jgi:hypothetical protein